MDGIVTQLRGFARLPGIGALAIVFGLAAAATVSAQERELSVGDRALGTISTSGGAVRYRLAISSPTTVTIRLDKVLDSELDPKIRVLDSSGDEIASDDDSGEALNSLLTVSLRPGRYTLVAEAVGTTTGDFVLSVKEAQVMSLSLGTVVLGELSANKPQALFKVIVHNRTNLRIRMNKVFSSSIDSKIRLIGPDGSEIASDDDGGGNLNSLVRQSVGPGEYTVVAEKVGGDGGEFFVSVYDAEAPLQGNEVRVGESVTGTITNGMLPVRTKLVITNADQDVSIAADKRSGSDLDPKLIVLNSEGEVIGSDDDSGDETNALLRLTLRRGEYEAFVGAYGTSAGPFTLSVREDVITPVRLGSPERGHLSGHGANVYRFTNERARDLIIAVDAATGSDLDPKVTLIGGNGEEVGSDDDSGEETNARLSQNVAAGVYRIVVSGYEDTEGPYTLTVSEAVVESKGNISVGESRRGMLEAGERHRYGLNVPSATGVTIDLTKSGSSDLDPKMELRDISGAVIDSDDDGGGSLNSRIRRRLQPGTYDVIVMGYEATSGGYELSVSTGSSQRVEVGMRRLGTISRAGQRDTYQYAVTSPQAIIIRVDRVLDSELDPKIVVYDESGATVAEDDDGGEGLNSRLRRQFSPGTYDIEVSAVGGASGDYVLSVERVMSIGDQSFPELTVGGRQVGEIRTSRQSDRYRLALTEPTDVVVRLEKLGSSSLDTKVILESEIGEEIASDDDGGEGTNSLLRRSLPAGTYAVVAQGYGETTGEYVLVVEQDRIRRQNLGAISGSREVTETIGSSGERDVYTFSIAERTRVSIGMNRVGSEGVDPHLELYDSNGGEIATNDDGGSGVNSLIEEELNPGEYRVVARAYGSSTGPYRLLLLTGERSVNERQMGVVQIGDTRRGTIPDGMQETRDLYRLQLGGSAQVEIRLDAPDGSGIDPHLRLLDDKGDEVAVNDDGGEGLNALIRRQLGRGEYAVVATGYARSSGDYLLRIEGVSEGGQMLSFDGDDHGFGIRDDRDVETALAIGKYSFRSRRHDNKVWSVPLGQYTNGSFRVTALKMEGPDRKGFGLCLRVHGRGDVPNMYLFEINGRGEYAFRRCDNARWHDIVAWTESAAIAKGDYAENTLRVQANGSNFILYINETEVNRVIDATFSEGYMGLSASEGLHILFDNLELPPR